VRDLTKRRECNRAARSRERLELKQFKALKQQLNTIPNITILIQALKNHKSFVAVGQLMEPLLNS
jgi:hypothetical protein